MERCDKCKPERQDGGMVWYCCECGDGPYGDWQTCCQNFDDKHPSPLPSGLVPNKTHPPKSQSSITPWTSQIWKRAHSDVPQQSTQLRHNVHNVCTVQDTTSEGRMTLLRDTLWSKSSSAVFKTTNPDNIQVVRDVSSLESGEHTTEEPNASNTESRVDCSATSYPDACNRPSEDEAVYIPAHEQRHTVVRTPVCVLDFTYDRDRGVITCVGESNGQRSTSALKPIDTLQAEKSGKGSKRDKRQDQASDEDHSDSSDRQHQPKKRRQRTKPTGPLLACPFYKRNPRWCHRPACFRSGFAEIFRLKEHLGRAHRTFQCGRCWQRFRTDDRLNAHERQDEGCSVVREEKLVFAINQRRWERISSRIRPGTREEQWNRIFQICFPNDPQIPLPYFDSDGEPMFDLNDDDEDFDEFVNCCGRELPRLISDRVLEACAIATEHTRLIAHAFVRDAQFRQMIDQIVRGSLEQVKARVPRRSSGDNRGDRDATTESPLPCEAVSFLANTDDNSTLTGPSTSPFDSLVIETDLTGVEISTFGNIDFENWYHPWYSDPDVATLEASAIVGQGTLIQPPIHDPYRPPTPNGSSLPEDQNGYPFQYRSPSTTTAPSNWRSETEGSSSTGNEEIERIRRIGKARETSETQEHDRRAINSLFNGFLESPDEF
ncbi:hypothetical protein P154DRAFT_573423 [Amniculicola lignicola CBS 123094]|uniref:C2H2-type domain-containing protein n=1 Tax=Amniculicola lignicola CBS 123094 TaxID=1392246 RepID=A0A6A5WQG7_9PLEO|nr:hypothetical protein P154DRAFT_573423 [Amniculicola lignicola CBS 123094]